MKREEQTYACPLAHTCRGCCVAIEFISLARLFSLSLSFVHKREFLLLSHSRANVTCGCGRYTTGLPYSKQEKVLLAQNCMLMALKGKWDLLLLALTGLSDALDAKLKSSRKEETRPLGARRPDFDSTRLRRTARGQQDTCGKRHCVRHTGDSQAPPYQRTSSRCYAGIIVVVA